MTERQIGITAIAIGVVIINGVIGHLFAPNGILFTPIVLVIVSALICFGLEMKPLWKSILLFGLVAFHDILIKLYSGGTADSEGQGFIHLFLFIGLIPSFGILLTSIFKNKQETRTNKIMAGLLFPTLMIIDLYLFSGLGLGRN